MVNEAQEFTPCLSFAIRSPLLGTVSLITSRFQTWTNARTYQNKCVVLQTLINMTKQYCITLLCKHKIIVEETSNRSIIAQKLSIL